MAVDLSTEQITEIKAVLKKHIPDRIVGVFGSRANGTARSSSDVDLIIFGNKSIGEEKLLKLKKDFSDSNLPFFVDIVEESTIDKDFKDAILIEYIILQRSRAEVIARILASFLIIIFGFWVFLSIVTVD